MSPEQEPLAAGPSAPGNPGHLTFVVVFGPPDELRFQAKCNDCVYQGPVRINSYDADIDAENHQMGEPDPDASPV